MIKKILLSIIIFSIFISISGCTNNNNGNNNSLVGKWMSIDYPEYPDLDDVITFTSDGKYELYESIDSIEPKLEMKYELLDNNEVRLYSDDNDSVYIYIYEFLDDGELRLDTKDGNTYFIFNRT